MAVVDKETVKIGNDIDVFVAQDVAAQRACEDWTEERVDVCSFVLGCGTFFVTGSG